MQITSPLFLFFESAPEDDWFYDTELFHVGDNPSVTFRRIKDKLISLGINTEEITPIESLWNPESRTGDYENYR